MTDLPPMMVPVFKLVSAPLSFTLPLAFNDFVNIHRRKRFVATGSVSFVVQNFGHLFECFALLYAPWFPAQHFDFLDDVRGRLLIGFSALALAPRSSFALTRYPPRSLRTIICFERITENSHTDSHTEAQ